MSNFKDKRVLIFGLGLNQGGVGSAKFFATQGVKVRVTDLKKAKILKPSLDELKDFPEIEYTLGEHKIEDINWADLIIKNPAVKPGNKFIEYAQKKGKRVEQDMGIFLDYIKSSQIIGVTGTKGKSTTASLIYDLLKREGTKLDHLEGGLGSHLGESIILAGNIGKSVLDIISEITPETLVILEISSFQLEAFDQHQVSPKWAVITNITPDHLNYYQTMDEYISAKKIIGKYQTKEDFLFLRKADPVTTQKDFLKDLKGQTIYFSANDLPQDFKPHLQGQHNLENIAAALKVAKVLNIPQSKTLNVVSTFSGIPFRMELIKQWHRVKIINDTTATGPDAGIKALQTASHMSSGNVVLICGGMNKNMPYEEYAKAVDDYAKKVFFLIGDSTEEIKRLMKKQSLISGGYDNLEKLLNDVKAQVKTGDIILFSPAATSFNLFQNEFDRGRKFNEAVQKIFK